MVIVGKVYEVRKPERREQGARPTFLLESTTGGMEVSDVDIVHVSFSIALETVARWEGMEIEVVCGNLERIGPGEYRATGLSLAKNDGNRVATSEDVLRLWG